MKRLVSSLAAGVLVLGCFVASASATHTNGQGPDKDFTNGSAWVTVDLPPQLGGGQRESHQHINGQADALGAGNADGTFFLTIFDFLGPGNDATASGTILCLDAVGNQEVDRALIDTSNPTGFEGFGLFGKHIDNGEPGHGPPADLAGGTLTGPPGANPTCPPGNTPFQTEPVQRGNFTVHDGI